jgi:outer membrane protein OmpA-like peptidoglycan-associated protein
MGGLDVFKSTFDDVREQWSTPENLGIPINSAADDAYFKLTQDGYKGFFSSARIDSEGMRDIYVAYFRTPNREQLVASTPAIFSEVHNYKLQKQSGVSVAMETPKSEEGTVSTITSRRFTEEEITEYTFKPLFYNKDEQILTITNKEELNKVARLLLQYPQLRLIVTSNSDGGVPKNFDLYFSLKRGEEIANYLIENGVNPDKITVKGCGINYPIAKTETESGFNAQALRLNRRIDLDILNLTGLPIRVKKEEPVVNQAIESKSDDYYRTAIQGLSYKVQIAAIKQMYNGSILSDYPDAMVEMRGKEEYYKFTVGLYQTFSSAEELRKELIRQGVTDSFIVPYVNGVRVNKDDSKIYSAAYPDLLNFLEKTE